MMAPLRHRHSDRAWAEAISGGADLSSEQFFKESFLRFLKERFNNDALLIAYTFGITERAAENWVHGVSLPNAYRLWLILQTEPDAMRHLRLVSDNPEPPAERAVDKLRRAS